MPSCGITKCWYTSIIKLNVETDPPTASPTESCVLIVVVYKVMMVMTVTMVLNDRNGLINNGGLIDDTRYVMGSATDIGAPQSPRIGNNVVVFSTSVTRITCH